MIRLRTPRLVLCDFVDSDAEFIYEIIGSKEGVPSFPRTYSRSEADLWIEKARARQAEYGAAFWMAVSKCDQTPIGFYGPVVQTVDGEQFHEVGWYTHQDFRSQGYAREAAIACIGWAFDHFCVDSIGALILPNNEASIAVADSVGMKPSRTVDHAGYPHVIYSVPKTAFRLIA